MKLIHSLVKGASMHPKTIDRCIEQGMYSRTDLSGGSLLQGKGPMAFALLLCAGSLSLNGSNPVKANGHASKSMTQVATLASAAVSNSLGVGAMLGPSQYLQSSNGLYKFWLQGDGNLVLRNASSIALWTTNTQGKGGVRLVLQGDGNLVMYTSSGKAVWSSGTAGKTVTSLMLYDNGCLAMLNGTTLVKSLYGTPPTATTYVLTVNNGSGSGIFVAGKAVQIVAYGAPSGQVFDKWIINSGNPVIANSSAVITTLTMPSSAVTVTASYRTASTVFPEDVKLLQPTGGPVISPIFGYNWTSGRIAGFLEEGENWYEWPIYDHSAGNKIMDRNTPEYWDAFVDELLLARLSVISFHHRGPVVGDMHVNHVKKFIEACDRAGVRDLFKIAYFEDTGMHGNNIQYSSNGASGSKIDCANVKHQEYLYLDYYKEFFRTIPKDMWYTHNGRPLIGSWNLLSDDFVNRDQASVMLNYCANRFQQDFGVKPLWVLQQNWFEFDSRFNSVSYVLGKHDWFCKACNENYTYRNHNNFKTGVISPGYKNEIGHVVDGNTNEMPRWVNGQNRAQVAFENGKDANLILLEGWTNLVESSGWYRSSKWKYPSEYINLVRHYAEPEPKTLRFEAEGADAFYDTTPNVNTFGDYSKRGLDVKRFETRNSAGILTQSGWYVDDVKAGEWLEYQNVEVGADTYRFTARIATNGTGKKMKLELDGAPMIELPNTGGNWQLIHLGQIHLNKGKYNFRLKFYSDGIKVDWFFMKKGSVN